MDSGIIVGIAIAVVALGYGTACLVSLYREHRSHR